MNVIEHKVPMLPTDTDVPKASDPRVKPFLDQLVEHGVMKPDGTSLKPCNLKRGIQDDNWVWRIEWD